MNFLHTLVMVLVTVTMLPGCWGRKCCTPKQTQEVEVVETIIEHEEVFDEDTTDVVAK